ncbi:MAG: DUF3365 domain-containing protein [Deltaproteobacteria bacterium]|nr:DUF3365 domain-containing protein [Deltaproteobacteria bacterium]
MKKIIFAVTLSIFILCSNSTAKDNNNNLKKNKEKAIATAMEITSLRSTLARESVLNNTKITGKTFKAVCGKVGKRVKAISKEEGFKIRHAAIKNRNPANAATTGEVNLIQKISNNKKTQPIEDIVTIEDKRYHRITAPIFVERACLACHGDKDTRPDFIKKKYPEDKAYGFKEGDLRGIISISFPIALPMEESPNP